VESGFRNVQPRRGFSRGLFYPVIDSGETHDDLWREEVSGPVVVVEKFAVS